MTTPTDDDGPGPGDWLSLDDTPEMRRLLATIREDPAARARLERLVAKALSDDEVPVDLPPDEDGERG